MEKTEKLSNLMKHAVDTKNDKLVARLVDTVAKTYKGRAIELREFIKLGSGDPYISGTAIAAHFHNTRTFKYIKPLISIREEQKKGHYKEHFEEYPIMDQILTAHLKKHDPYLREGFLTSSTLHRPMHQRIFK